MYVFDSPYDELTMLLNRNHQSMDLDIQKYRQILETRLTLANILFITRNTPTGASTNPKNFNLNKNLNMNLILIET